MMLFTMIKGHSGLGMHTNELKSNNYTLVAFYNVCINLDNLFRLDVTLFELKRQENGTKACREGRDWSGIVYTKCVCVSYNLQLNDVQLLQ